MTSIIDPSDLSGTTTPSTDLPLPPTTSRTIPLTSQPTTIPLGTSGHLSVRPYRSSSSSRLRALITFHPRASGLDRQHSNASDEFRGFYSLFWITLFLLFVRTSYESWEINRTLLSTTFGKLITRDGWVLALSDFIMVSSMFVCVPFVQALKRGWWRYYWVGVVLQHAWQCCFLGMAVWWGYHREWYWVQAGFLVLHALSSMMKMHSYCAHNGMLSSIHLQLTQTRSHLSSILSTQSTPGAIESEAAERKKEDDERKAEEERRGSAGSGGSSMPGTPGLSGLQVGTPLVPPGVEAMTTALQPAAGVGGGAAGGYISHSDVLRLRLSAAKGRGESAGHAGGEKDMLAPNLPTMTAPEDKTHHLGSSPLSSTLAVAHPQSPSNPSIPLGTSLEPTHTHSPNTSSTSLREPHTLSWSSDETVSTLAKNIDLMLDELTSNPNDAVGMGEGKGKGGVVTWPDNITYRNYWEFMCMPTLCYQLSYPRTKTMRPLYVLEKVFATFGVFSLIYTITEHYIFPHLPKAGDPLLKTYANLALPMVINYLLIFYIIFECVCNAFAEMTYFADREFYQDWWNSTTWDEFARKWNKPVHTFLLRHVYASTVSTYRLSKTSATFVTFLLSALCHEMVMAVVAKKIRLYLFAMQMAQLPMIYIGKLPIVRRNKTIGNIIFWLGLMSGFPLLAIAYLVF